MYYKKVFRLQTGKYVQVHQEDEPWNTIDIDRTVGAIILVPQYNLQGGFLFGILTTGKHLRRSHCTPFNITEDVIECYDNFNTKGNPDEPLVGKFHDQPIPPDYYDLLNDDDEDNNNITGAPDDYVLPDKK